MKLYEETKYYIEELTDEDLKDIAYESMYYIVNNIPDKIFSGLERQLTDTEKNQICDNFYKHGDEIFTFNPGDLSFCDEPGYDEDYIIDRIKYLAIEGIKYIATKESFVVYTKDDEDFEEFNNLENDKSTIILCKSDDIIIVYHVWEIQLCNE